MVVKGVYRRGSNYYWFGKDEIKSIGCDGQRVHIDIDDKMNIGDLTISVTTLETTPDYHLIVGGYRLTAGEYYKFRTEYLETTDLPFIPADMSGECTHIRYKQVIGGAFIELYKAYRCDDCGKLF